jgi:proteic killer suppression protein
VRSSLSARTRTVDLARADAGGLNPGRWLRRITLAVHNVLRYACGVLQSFRDKDTEPVWQRKRSKRLDDPTQRAALRKLLILDAADRLGDLRVPPGNRLEKLKGDRANTYSIRVNDQWRICFRWTTAGPEDVEIVDYH